MKTTSKSVVNKKKKLQTTLGKAPAAPKEGTDDVVDVSHVGRSIDTSIHGLREVVSLLQNATAEVKHYITYECNVMYECRICRTIFRSLANFILHKRRYCRKNYSPAEEAKCRDSCQNDNTSYVSTRNSQNDNTNHNASTVNKPPSESSQKVRGAKKKISTVLQKLLQKQEQREDVEKIASADLSNENEKDYEKVDESNTVAFEKIDSTSAGVFQTMFKDMIQEHEKMDFMKTEVMELHGIFSKDEAVLGPDGKIHPFEAENAPSRQFTPKNNLICTICNQKFSTRKTLTYHVKYKHNSTRMVYQCPVCTDQFANAWCVFRHLYKVHRKTSAQIRKMRDDIHASAFRKDQEPSTVKKDVAEESGSGSSDTENQWMKNMESDIDLQMCGGCGKRFERKAALHSHSQMCLKRITICNTIKEKNMKQALEEARNQKITKANNYQPKGSERRKPILLRKKCAKPQLEPEDATSDTPDENQENENKDEADKNQENEKESDVDRNQENEGENEINSVDEKSQEVEEVICIPADPEETQSQELPETTCDDSEKAIKVEAESTATETESTQIVSNIETLENAENVEQQGDVEFNNENEAESSNDENLQLGELSINDSHTLSGEEVTLDPSMDFEPEYDVLQMGNEYLSMFRSSLSQADICDIIGVPLIKTETDDNEVKTEPDTEMEEQIRAVNDNNISSSIAQLFQDDNSWCLSARLDADIETTIKEISLLHHYQLPPRNISAEKPPKRKRASPIEKKVKVKYTSDKTSLECKAEKYVDMRKCLCLPCDVEFSSDCDLMEHMSQHFSWYCYQCSKCNYMCYSEDTCLEHVSKQHTVGQSTLENVVLPVPNWKALKLSTDFVPLKVDLQARVTQYPVIQAVVEQQPRPARQRRKSVKTIQNDFLYDLDKNTKKLCKNSVNGSKQKSTKVPVTRRKAMKPTQKIEKNGKKHNGTSKLLVMKPLKVYMKKTKAVRKGSAIVNSSKDLGGKE